MTGTLIEDALRKCIIQAIESVGIENFKKCSFFMSNRDGLGDVT